MSEPERTIEQAEEEALSRLRPELRSHLALVGSVHNILFETICAFNGREIDTMPPSLRACLYLLGKLTNDLRCVGVLAERGYGVQACALGASVYETAHTIAWACYDEGRAQDWLSHDDPKKMPLTPRQLTRMNFADFKLPTEVEEAEYRVYVQLCWMKHSNPVATAIKGLRPPDEWNDEGLSRVGPTTDELSINAAWFALQHCGRLAGLAAKMICAAHLDPERSKPILRQLDDCQPLLNVLRARAMERWGNLMPLPGQW